jgi:hypothetical protein
LFERGVDNILDLGNEDDRDLENFERFIQEEVTTPGKRVEYRVLALPRKSAPTRAMMKAVLDSIDQALTGGYTVFAGCGTQYKQSGMIAGCYLARHGLTGKQALE